jgi:sulfoxide reductase heme-binding subunit YedZ
MPNIRFLKLLLFTNALVPLAMLLCDVTLGRSGPNPTELITRTTGMLTLVFLLLTLAVTPARKITGLNSLVQFRRMLGLFAFFYGSLHLLTYIGFDRFFKLATIPSDVMSRPFIAFGMIAFLLMVPLAITSTNKMVKRIGGKRWSQLHKLIYGAGVAGALHFWFFVKSDTRLPLTFGFILLLLLAHRVFVKVYPPERERHEVSTTTR